MLGFDPEEMARSLGYTSLEAMMDVALRESGAPEWEKTVMKSGMLNCLKHGEEPQIITDFLARHRSEIAQPPS